MKPRSIRILSEYPSLQRESHSFLSGMRTEVSSIISIASPMTEQSPFSKGSALSSFFFFSSVSVLSRIFEYVVYPPSWRALINSSVLFSGRPSKSLPMTDMSPMTTIDFSIESSSSVLNRRDMTSASVPEPSQPISSMPT